VSIVHVVAAGEIGGAERMLVDLVRGSEAPVSIALLTPNAELRALFTDAGVAIDDRGPVREHPLAFLRPSDVRWLTDVLRRRGARIVHLHTFASQWLGTRAAVAVGAKIVRTEHSTRVYDDPSCRPFARWTLKRADRIAFISSHVERVAFARMPSLASARTSVIHNGIDPERFAIVPPPPADARLRLVASGRLDPRKGLDLALDAIARVPNVTLEIVGEGSERARLEKLAAPLGERVRFSGYTSDVRGALARADAVLSSAREEGLGIALLEAMAMGRPVIAVPVGGIPEIVSVEASHETGWLASTRTAPALAEVVDQAARSKAELERRGERARARVVRLFTVGAMRAKYAKLYEELGIQAPNGPRRRSAP
jgi:glycosyltransferase involved in cell wall biosynthesis